MDGKNLTIRNNIEVGAFRQESADETVGIFDGGLFPGAVGMTEEGAGAELAVDFSVESVLDAVVISDGLAESSRSGSENTAEGGERALGGFILHFEDAGIARLALDSDFEGRAAFAQHEIDFPVACLSARVGFFGSMRDGNAFGNGVFGSGQPIFSAVPVMACQVDNEMRSLAINPAIDRLMADRTAGLTLEAHTDEFRRKASLQGRFYGTF